MRSRFAFRAATFFIHSSNPSRLTFGKDDGFWYNRYIMSNPCYMKLRYLGVVIVGGVSTVGEQLGIIFVAGANPEIREAEGNSFFD